MIPTRVEELLDVAQAHAVNVVEDIRVAVHQIDVSAEELDALVEAAEEAASALRLARDCRIRILEEGE